MASILLNLLFFSFAASTDLPCHEILLLPDSMMVRTMLPEVLNSQTAVWGPFADYLDEIDRRPLRAELVRLQATRHGEPSSREAELFKRLCAEIPFCQRHP